MSPRVMVAVALKTPLISTGLCWKIVLIRDSMAGMSRCWDRRLGFQNQSGIERFNKRSVEDVRFSALIVGEPMSDFFLILQR